MSHIITISKQFRFEASHVLPKHPGKCSRLHGHSWVLTVSVFGPIDEETGFVCDFDRLKSAVNLHLIDLVDHQHLGQGAAICRAKNDDVGAQAPPLGQEFYPSSENLVVAFAKMLNPFIKEIRNGQVTLAEIALEETCTSRAVWRYDQAN